MIVFEYIFLEVAQAEYESSLLWYMERSQKAAGQFVVAVEHTVALICSNPYMWRNEYEGFHELCMKKYPFSIIFIVDAQRELVVITSVYHHSRNAESKYHK